MPDKVCFVIAPIGEEGSEIRKRSNRVFTYVIEPAAQQCGYKALRADKISTPGIITNQVIQEVINAPMVVADLTGHNANAFYELAVRHMVKKPLVQMITKGEKIPFDVSGSRVLHYDEPDLETVEKTREELVQHIRSAEGGAGRADNPISVSVDLQALKASADPVGVQLGELAAAVTSSLATIRAEIADLKGAMTPRLTSTLPSFFVPGAGGGFTLGRGPGGRGLREIVKQEIYNLRSQDQGKGPSASDEKKG